MGWLTLLVVASLGGGSLFADESTTTSEGLGWEEPPVLRAQDHLGTDLLEGPDFRVDDRVLNDGYLNTYGLLTPWGRFEAYGEEMLRVRIDEVGALRQLSELGRSKVFLDSLSGSVRSTWESAARVVRQPVETLEGVPGGIGRLFVRTGRKIEEGYVDLRELADEVSEEVAEHRQEKADEAAAEAPRPDAGDEQREKPRDDDTLDKVAEEAARQARRELGVSRAQRRWARALGVDPYTDNEVLRRELERVARAAAAGRFATKLVPSVALVGELGKIDDLVWSKDPKALEKHNRRQLFGLGVDEKVVDALLDNRSYTPTRRTSLINALLALDGTFGRYQLVRLAAGAMTPQETFFFERGSELLAVYHRDHEPFDEILTGPLWGGGLTKGGTFVLALPVDYLVWTREAAELLPEISRRYRGDSRVKQRVLWLTGTTSKRARSELEALGWRVETGKRPVTEAGVSGEG